MATDPDPSPMHLRAASDGPLRLFRQAPRVVWALVVLNGLLLTCWSLLTPIYHAPDEPTHADAVMRLVEGYGWGHVGHTEITQHGDAATVASPYGTPQRPRRLSNDPIPAADSVPRYDRADWGDLVDPSRPYQRATVQQMTQHPPGYYYVEAAVIRAFGGDHQRWDRAVGLMRLVSVLMIAPLPLLAWAAAFRLIGDRRAGIAAAAVPLVIPELTHIGGVVNNDNALTLTGGLVLVGVACVLRGDRRIWTAVFLGVTLGLALFSKGIALVLPPLVLAAYVTAWAYDRRRVPAEVPRLPLVRTIVPPVAVVAVLSFAFGGWWYVTNLIHYGAVQPPVPGFPPGEFLGNNVGRLVDIGTSSMLQRYWGSIGWYEVQLPFRYVYAAGAVTFALLAVAFVRSRRPEGTRPALLLLLWPTLASYALVAAQAVNWYRDTHYYRGLSGRYLFVGVVGVAVVVGIGATRFPALRRWAPLAILTGGAVMQAKAAWLAVLVWWRPRGGSLGQAWDALLSWSPWSPTIVKGVLALTVLAALLVVEELVRAGLRRDDSDPSGADGTAGIDSSGIGRRRFPGTPSPDAQEAGSAV